MSQLTLLGQRRFGAFFWVQFLGAFNDNVFRNALVILIAFRSMSVAGLPPGAVVALAGGIFILPFVTFSPFAGQLADTRSKSRLIRWIKAAEIVIMVLAAVAFAHGGLIPLLAVLALMGAQSAAFGPVKYGILPELVDEDDLVGANALVEMGTFLAILLGTIVGGLLIGRGEIGPTLVSVTVVVTAVVGWLAALRMPYMRRANPAVRLLHNPIVPFIETIAATRRVRSVFLSILGLSWFWFFGSAVLALLPTYTRDVLGGSEDVVTLFLAVFCTGVAGGSLLCERLSGRKVELGLVPLGSLGMSIFAVDLFLRDVATPNERLGAAAFLATPGSWRTLIDLWGLAFFGGIFTVPLYAFIQHRTSRRTRSRVIAGNNIMGAAFMVGSAAVILVCTTVGMSIPQMFLMLAILNAVVAAYIYTVIPEFLFRFLCWLLSHLLYRLRTEGRDHIPDDGPVVLACNHVTFIDWLIVSSACHRPARFVMYHGFLKLPLLGVFFRDAKVIPIASAREDAATLDAAFDEIATALEAGEPVCIFPEGRLTPDGTLQPFRPGIEKIVARTPVPVVPMALTGLWGSYFSRMGGAAMRRPFRRVWSRIGLTIGPAIPPDQVDAADLGRRIAELGDFDPPE